MSAAPAGTDEVEAEEEEQEGNGEGVEDTNTAVDKLELGVGVQIGDDARNDPKHRETEDAAACLTVISMTEMY